MRSFAYRLLTESPAKKKAKKFIEIADLMGFSLKLSRAQEIVARLMGYDDWMELVKFTREAPERGIPDQMLLPSVATERRKFQVSLLVETFGFDAWTAETLVGALAPTGEGWGLDWPMVTKLGLRLNDEDVAWLDQSMVLVREFDAAVRPLYALGSPQKRGLTHIRLEHVVHSTRQLKRQTTTTAEIVRWVAQACPDEDPLAGDRLANVMRRAEEASRAFLALDGRIRALGAAPMLVPIDWTFLMLFRTYTETDDRAFYTAINPEPWLHIGFDLPGFCFSPENEWNASRALTLQLGLRREFFDAGWSEAGDEWQVTFREGNSAKEQIALRAHSAGAAYAWAAAARAAIRIAKGQMVGAISLLSVRGSSGVVDADQVLSVARDEAIIRRGKLLDVSKLRVRGLRKAA